MVDPSVISEEVIVIADRGYKSYNVFVHIKEKDWKYIHDIGLATASSFIF